jgi:hypothetical protein
MRIGFELMPAEPSGYFGVEAIVKLHVGIIKDAPCAVVDAKLNHGVAQPILIADIVIEEQTKRGKIIHQTYWHL